MEKGNQQWTPAPSLPREAPGRPLALTQAELWTAEVSACAQVRPAPWLTLLHQPLSTLGAQLSPQGRDMQSRAELHHC